jgi:hypothetical protein
LNTFEHLLRAVRWLWKKEDETCNQKHEEAGCGEPEPGAAGSREVHIGIIPMRRWEAAWQESSGSSPGVVA